MRYPQAAQVKYTGTYSPRSAFDHYEVYKVFNQLGESYLVSVHENGYVGVADNLTGQHLSGTMQHGEEEWEDTVERLDLCFLTRDCIEQLGTILVEMSNT